MYCEILNPYPLLLLPGSKMEYFDNTSNITNTTSYSHHECSYNYCVEDTIYRKVLGTIIFVVVWPFVVQDMKFFPLGRPAAALLGATMMAVFVITPQEQVFRIIGDRGNIQTICLLVGMMMLSYYYDREGLLHIVALWIYGKQERLRKVLWKVCILSAVMSAIITNDATCVVITPLLLNAHMKQKRPHREIAPLLLGIATSANIGSASTFFGNPQNAYIASNANLSLLIFFITSLPAAIIGIAINTGLLYLVYFRVIRKDNIMDDPVIKASEHSSIAACNGLETPPTHSTSMEEKREEHVLVYDKSKAPYLSSEIAEERDKMYYHESPKPLAYSHSSSTHSLPLGNSRPGDLEGMQETSLSHSNIASSQYGAANTTNPPPKICLSPPSVSNNGRAIQPHNAVGSQTNLHPATVEEAEDVVQTKSIRERSLREKIFLVWLGLATLLLIALLAVPPLEHVQFSLGLLPVGIAVLTMLVDTIVNRRYTRDAMTKIDWPIILMLFGLFVWLAGFENTSLPEQAFKKMRNYMKLSTVWGVLLFTVFVIIGSNILSNVPLVILIIDELDEFYCGLDDCSQLTGVLLAWVSTIAGNFTLIGSVANLIVAEKARSCADYNLTFWEYLKFGLPSTILVLFTGLPVVYFTGRFVNIST